MFLQIIKIIFILLCYTYLFLTYRFMNVFKGITKEVKFIDKKDINTGDIFILNFQSNNVLEDGTLNFRYFHGCIAVWEEDELYLIEYGDYKEGKEGILKHHFSEWSYYHINSIILMNKLSIKDDSEKKRGEVGNNILNFYEKFKDTKDIKSWFDFDWIRFVTQNYNKYESLDLENNKKITCIEILAFLLCEVEIVKKNKSVSYLPNKFIGMQGFDFEDGYSYDKNFLCNLSFY